MNTDNAWNEMLEESRALGGVAENIRLGHGEFGRGLFPIDPSQPIRISIPDNLLVSYSHVVIENGVFRISAASPIGARERAFIEQYERDFSWGAGRMDVERFLAAMNELPEHLRELLTTKFGLGTFFNPVSPQSVQNWYFQSRVITRGNRVVVMPIIEMANHGGEVSYDTTSDVSLRGLFDGEVLVRYTNPTDPYEMFVHWMFAPNEPMAFSMGLEVTRFGRQFVIGRDFAKASQPFVPKVTIEGDRIVAQYLLLGVQNFPRIPKGAFRRAMAHARLQDPDEVYDFIQFANRQNFLHLIGALEGIDSPAMPVLKALAWNQSRALSHHFGCRQV
jgi:hypothetical protein